MGYKVNQIALWDTQVRPNSQWKPWENTIAYYEFNDNINDTSWNNRNLSMKNGSFTYWTIWEYKYVNIPQSAWTNWLSNFPFDINSNTVSFWIKNPYYTKSDSNAMVADFWRGWSYWTSRLNTYSWAIKIDNVSYTIPDDTKRYYVCIVYDNWQTNLYVNWEYVWANTCWLASWTTSVSFALNNAPDTNSSTYSWQCQMSQLIFESVKRTATEISNYYNNTKTIYNPPATKWASAVWATLASWEQHYVWNSQLYTYETSKFYWQLTVTVNLNSSHINDRCYVYATLYVDWSEYWKYCFRSNSGTETANRTITWITINEWSTLQIYYQKEWSESVYDVYLSWWYTVTDWYYNSNYTPS